MVQIIIRLFAIALALMAPAAAHAGGWPVFDYLTWNRLGDGFSSVVSSVEAAFKGQVQAMGNVADGQHAANVATMKTVEQTRAMPEYELPPDPCVTAGAAEAGKYASTGRAQAESMQNAQLTDRMLNATTGARGASTNMDAYNDFRSKYDPRRGTDLPNADVLVDSLLSGAGKPGKTPNYTFDEKQMGAAQRYVLNAANVSPLPTLTDKQESSEGGHQYIALQRSEQAKYSLAQSAFTEALSWRTPIKGLREKVGDMWRAMAQVISPQGSLPSGEMSARAFLFNEVDRRYSNPNWYVSVAAASQTAAIKEGLYMQALELQLRLLELEKLERTNLLLGQSQIVAMGSSPQRQQALAMFEQLRATR